MNNSSALKNELIFQYAAGTTSIAKSLMASTYLFLNSNETSLYNFYENYCGEELKNTKKVNLNKLKAEDCTINKKIIKDNNISVIKNPLNKFIKSYDDLKWKNIFRGFYEYKFNLSSKENAKLIKMDPGSKVPLHSHNGKEYILVLEGSFYDEYGTYTKGSLQINDSKIKHTPSVTDKDGCICLSIVEKDLIFFGPLAFFVNIAKIIKSFFNIK